MKIKRGISLLLMLSLVLTSMVGLTGEQAQAETKPAPMGEIVYSHFAYHDTWTTQWQGAGDISSDFGKKLGSNLKISWDRGAPTTTQNSNIILSAEAFNVKNAEEFKKQYVVIPLQPVALIGSGYSAEQAEKLISDTLKNAPTLGTNRDKFDEKYVYKGVTNYSVNNSGIYSSGDTLNIPISYTLATPDPNDIWGEDLTTKVGDINSGLPALVQQYKASGLSYADFKAKAGQFFILPESSLQHLWNNGTLASGTVGWRWYIPFAVIRIAPTADLNVTGLIVDIDEPTGDITCEASVENSFLFIK